MTSETVEWITLPVEGHLQVVELVQKLDLGKHGVASGVARFCEAADKENEPLLIEIIDVLVVSHVGAPAVSTHFEAPGHPDALLATILGGPYGGPDGPDGPQFAKFRSASDFDALCVPEYTAVLLSGVVRGVVYVAADNKWQPGMRRALDVSV